jgi:hypothetical protein
MAVLNQNLNRAFDLFELRPANEISSLDSYKKTLSKRCVDPLRPPDLLGLGAVYVFLMCCIGQTLEIEKSIKTPQN